MSHFSAVTVVLSNIMVMQTVEFVIIKYQESWNVAYWNYTETWYYIVGVSSWTVCLTNQNKHISFRPNLFSIKPTKIHTPYINNVILYANYSFRRFIIFHFNIPSYNILSFVVDFVIRPIRTSFYIKVTCHKEACQYKYSGVCRFQMVNTDSYK